MTFIAYEPEPPMFESIHTAFQRFTAPSIGCTICADPLGPVNQIVSLVVGNGSRHRRVKAGLVSRLTLAGAEIRVERVDWPHLRYWSSSWGLIGATGGERGYRVTVDGHTALYASDSEIWPPTPAEPVPWRVRTHRAVKSWLRTRARAAGDRVAARFGYVHGDEAGW